MDNVLELREALMDSRYVAFRKRLEAVALRGEFRSNEVVGTIVGVSPVLVSHWVSAYCNGGLNALLINGRPRNMSVKDEVEFLAQFESAARGGGGNAGYC
jgi:transposase